MIKIIPILCLGVLVFGSCSDEDTTPTTTQLTTAEKIQNKWNVTSVIDYNFVGTSTTLDNTDTLDLGAGAYFNFRSDNKVYVNWDGDLDTSDYQIISDNAISFEGEAYKIKTLTATEFKLTYEERTDTPYYDNVVLMNR